MGSFVSSPKIYPRPECMESVFYKLVDSCIQTEDLEELIKLREYNSTMKKRLSETSFLIGAIEKGSLELIKFFASLEPGDYNLLIITGLMVNGHVSTLEEMSKTVNIPKYEHIYTEKRDSYLVYAISSKHVEIANWIFDKGCRLRADEIDSINELTRDENCPMSKWVASKGISALTTK